MLGVGMLLTLPYWLYKMIRHGKYRAGLAARLGRVPPHLTRTVDSRPVIWIHAVSVGEVLAVAGLVEEMRRRFPGFRVLISTTTNTGQELARKRFGEDSVFYFPLDFEFALRPYLQALKPELVVLAETEFWPNFLHLAHATGARIAVVNARISDRSFPSYQRFRWALRRMLAQVDVFLAQTAEDATRLQTVGANADRVQVTGNLKFDVSLPAAPPIVETLRRALASDGAAPSLVCGSTVEGEEAALLKAFESVRTKYPAAVMILAPRRPERFDEIAELLSQSGMLFHRRSHWDGEPLAGRVLLVDSIGELAALYALADVAFVGGSLVPRGGHNIIEPAMHGVAIITGQHTENFRDIVAVFQSRNAVRIASMPELPRLLMQLFEDDNERRALGLRAKETMQSQTGATARTLAALKTLLDSTEAPSPSVQAAHTH